ncbi:MAG TPA: glutaredoxin domain-containing protein [Patescibacteria group bacterium]
MKITVYTIKDCAFSKQEKEYLNTNKLTYEEKDLETNKAFLTEMLAISNNFAGTPVTRVEKDDGSIAVLKGFTKEEFDTTFGFAPTSSVQTPNLGVSTNDSTVPSPINDTPIPPPSTIEVPSAETIPPAPIPAPFDSAQGKPVETPVIIASDMSAGSSSRVSTAEEEASVKADPLKSIMNDLQSKSQPTEPIAQPVEPTVEPLPPNAPTIPDFPAK